MKTFLLLLSSIASLCGLALASASGATFVPGDVFSLAGSAGHPLINITAGGDFSGLPPLTFVFQAEGTQMAWSADLTTLYVTKYMTGPEFTSVWAISATGAATSFARGVGSPSGIVRTADGRLLTSVANRVTDITVGGDLSSAPPFATGFRRPENLVQITNGHILLVDTDGALPRVLDITAGGVFTDNDQGFAFGFTGGLNDIVQITDGRIFVAGANNEVFDITAGGDFSLATPFATGQAFGGLTQDGSGRILASVPGPATGNAASLTGKVYDITSGGDFASAAPFAFGLDRHTGTALDTVPAPEPGRSAMLAAGAVLLLVLRGRKSLAK